MEVHQGESRRKHKGMTLPRVISNPLLTSHIPLAIPYYSAPFIALLLFWSWLTVFLFSHYPLTTASSLKHLTQTALLQVTNDLHIAKFASILLNLPGWFQDHLSELSSSTWYNWLLIPSRNTFFPSHLKCYLYCPPHISPSPPPYWLYHPNLHPNLLADSLHTTHLLSPECWSSPHTNPVVVAFNIDPLSNYLFMASAAVTLV